MNKSRHKLTELDAEANLILASMGAEGMIDSYFDDGSNEHDGDVINVVQCNGRQVEPDERQFAPDLFRASEPVFEINKADIEKEPELLGKGCNGRVYKGVYKGLPVALKEPSLGFKSSQIVDKVLEWVLLNHKNVIKVFGFCLPNNIDRPVSIVMELAECSLRKYRKSFVVAVWRLFQQPFR